MSWAITIDDLGIFRTVDSDQCQDRCTYEFLRNPICTRSQIINACTSGTCSLQIKDLGINYEKEN